MRFSDSKLRKFWKSNADVERVKLTKGIDPVSADRLKTLLSALNAATRPEDMAQPAWAFHPLKGDRRGQYAVEVRANWRLVFEWEGGEAVRVKMEDYHDD